MAITVKHSKVSAIPDGADASVVRPSDWNADHALVGVGTMAEQDADNVAISGGSINNTPIGGTTPAAGAFTTLSASGALTTNGLKEDTSGNLGLGTSSPAWRLDVVGSTGASGAVSSITTVDNPAAGRDFLRLVRTGSGTIGSLEYSEAGAVGLTAASTVVFKTASTERLRIDSAGNLGIGITPSAWDSSIKALEISGASIGAQPLATWIQSNAYVSSGGVYKYKADGPARNFLTDSSGFSWHKAPSGTAGNPITFTQAMTLDAGGNLLVGTTSQGYQNANAIDLDVASGSSGYIVVNHANGSASGKLYVAFGYNGDAIGSITQNGTTAVAYNTTSDHRLKENVRPANAARFMDIEFVDFEWVDGRHDCGVIAHQLQSVYPDLVIGEKDATEIRQVEIEPAIPEVTEQQLVTEAALDEEGNEVTPAVYETVEITPAVEAVTEDQTFPVYQQVNYIGLIGRMGTVIQKQQRMIEAMEARLSALEAA